MKYLLILPIFLTGCNCLKSEQPIILTPKEVAIEVPIRCKVKYPEKPISNLSSMNIKNSVNEKGDAIVVDRRNFMAYSEKLELVLAVCADNISN